MNDSKSKKIIRFIRKPDQSRVFNYESTGLTDSTFIMRSLRFYRDTEDNRINDIHELHVQLRINDEDIDIEDIEPNHIYVSCWSLFEKIDIAVLADRFLVENCERNGIAIISNVSKVENLIQTVTRRFNQPLNRYENREIIYFDDNTMFDIDRNLVNRSIRFMKQRNDFEVEHEYRFVFDAINVRGVPLIISSDVVSESYIDEIISFGNENVELFNHCANRGIVVNRFMT